MNRYTSPIPYSICFCATVIMTVIGPFGTYGSANVTVLCLYWAVLVFWAAFSSILISSTVRVSLKSPSILGTTLSTLLFTATYVPLLIWFTDWVFPSEPLQRPSNDRLAIYVLLITTAIGGLIYQIETHLKPAQSQGPRLWRRLPADLQTDIIRLCSDGHFVSVHTIAGTRRIRMRFADAVAEMDGVEGACVHRSHWIARTHVRGILHENNRSLLVMSDGKEVPVSRTYRAEAVRMGFLQGEARREELELG